MKAAYGLAALALLLAGCGGETGRGTPIAGPEHANTTAGPEGDAVPPASPFPPVSDEPDEYGVIRPPDVRLRYAGSSVELTPYTFCYGTACVDGSPQQSPHVGSPAEVFLDFALPDWRFQVTQTPAGRRCGRDVAASVERLGARSFVVRPGGHPGSYRITVFARGPDGGDLATEFRWTTPAEGRLPEPRARLALVADHDGEPDSYGVELSISDLAHTPRRATARITGTAANGRSMSFEATRSRGCRPEGSVLFDGPDHAGRAVAALGPPPFRYRVVLRLDARRYVAVATWPADEIDGNEPSARLVFHPGLPALH
jgi:hypothetical protein